MKLTNSELSKLSQPANPDLLPGGYLFDKSSQVAQVNMAAVSVQMRYKRFEIGRINKLMKLGAWLIETSEQMRNLPEPARSQKTEKLQPVWDAYEVLGDFMVNEEMILAELTELNAKCARLESELMQTTSELEKVRKIEEL